MPPPPHKPPKKLIRQLATEKTRGEGANPSQLGDPVSLEVETNAVAPSAVKRSDEDDAGATPAGKTRPSAGSRGGGRRGEGGSGSLMGKWDIAGGLGELAGGSGSGRGRDLKL
ncbi:hypothetical protein QBC33DRAFT_247373 [Phialemonium atrogriseum]|uniref:Uncharacterized protein n=1 Tax=Phialemonium atrogriseum TaxID=1093897 RepID=A0AAJ0FC43_9PEZI|nr:uncharacterized protein QBC33DRAFT_247373 [Phialemonium atrogriseum]KAK1763196.1 hypothetical protein QBC33DRAFT_247373 [Phialemonium atrogriseum]